MTQQRTNALLLILLAVSGLTACQNYYMVANNNQSRYSAQSLDSLQRLGKHFILRGGDQAYYMKDLAFDRERQAIHFTTDTLQPWNKLHLAKGYGKLRYVKSNQFDRNVLNEVHLYVAPGDYAIGQAYQLPLDAIMNMEVLVHDKKRTGRSKRTGAAIITGGVIVGGLALMTAMWSASGGLDWRWD